MEFKREKEVLWLADHRNKDGQVAVKIVAGLRRVGKSYLLNTLFFNYLTKSKEIDPKDIRQFALNTMAEEERNTPVKLKALIEKAIQERPSLLFVFVDEVQLAGSGFATAMNDLAQSHPQINFYVTGSTSQLLSRRVKAEFGQGSPSLVVRPLSFREVHEAMGMNIQDYQSFGGVPSVLVAPDDSFNAKIESELESVYLADIVEEAKGLGYSLDKIKRVLDFVLADIANYVSVETLAREVMRPAAYQKLSPEEKTAEQDNIAKLLSYFEDSYLLESVAHIDFKGKSTLGNAKKFYCVDLGLASGARSFHPDATKIYENAVYLELIHRGFSVMVGRIVCDSVPQGKAQEKEIDFLADKGRQHYVIQVFLTALTAAKFNKEVGNFEEGNFTGQKLCITEQKQFQPSLGVTMMNLEDFLVKDQW